MTEKEKKGDVSGSLESGIIDFIDPDEATAVLEKMEREGPPTESTAKPDTLMTPMVPKPRISFDPNLPDNEDEDEREEVKKDDGDEKYYVGDAEATLGHVNELAAENGEPEDDSPYPEVRAAVLNYDSGGHANTIRAWAIGLLLTTLGSAINSLLSMRQPYIVLGSYVAQVVAYPIGCAWARWMPRGKFPFFGREVYLNPGMFTKKEHCITVIMANATFNGGTAYATEIIVAQRAFYRQRFGWPFEMVLCITNQMIGFGLAGFFNPVLVDPAPMIWPANLINTAMFTALHDRVPTDPQKTNGWRIARYKFFSIICIASFVWYWFPGVIAPVLSNFAWITFIKPQNVVINQLFGGWTGMSLLPMTFDWTQIAGFNFSPLISPWHAIANTLIGMVFFIWVLGIALHYSNFAYAQYLPISDSHSYDNTANHYNVSRIIDPVTKEFNEQLYQSYSPLFLSTTFALQYGLSFATITAVVVHTALFHGKSLWRHMQALITGRGGVEDEKDIHSRLMEKYAKVPVWWYLALFAVMMGGALGIVLAYDTKLTWWAFLFSIAIGAAFFVPIGIVQATTNIAIGLNVLTEFIIGYIQPGRPMAMMLFKAYGYMALYQGLGFCQDMKLGHYMKLPPRLTFSVQLVACLWSSVVQVAVINWGLSTIKDVCTSKQSFHFSCPNGRVFFNASIIWGAIGPARMFSAGHPYHPMLYFFVAGAALPALIYAAARQWPRSPIRYLNAAVIFGGTGLIPPATPLNYLSWGIVGFVFNKWIRQKYRGWWMQYNYILSAGLDVGLALSTIVIFCALALPDVTFPTWWGGPNGATQNTMDALDTAIRVTLAEGETFGPPVGSW